MAISAVTSSDATSAATALSAGAPTGAESEQRFLKLLVAQLNNQDPMNPLDNAQLTSQLAQMSTVTGIEKLNTAFASLLAQSGSSQVLQAASLIGRSVLVPGKDLTIKEGGAASFGVDRPAAATSVKASITNSAGHVVRSFDLGAMPQGVQTLSWDGKGDDAAVVADGVYKLNIQATGGGANVAAVALTYANVNSVAQGPNGVALDLTSGNKVNFSDIRQILSAPPVASLN
jgi:flagellar basal-body rod modification protein FlgD